MTDAVVAVENTIDANTDAHQSPSYIDGARQGNVMAPILSLGLQSYAATSAGIVPVADTDAIHDAVLIEVKKLLDFYGHDIPIWDEVVALAKKV